MERKTKRREVLSSPSEDLCRICILEEGQNAERIITMESLNDIDRETEESLNNIDRETEESPNAIDRKTK